MSSTSSALVKMGQLVSRIRTALNYYLPVDDRLPADCTLEDETEVIEALDVNTVLAPFLGGIEVHPEADYSINDADGKITVLRTNAFYQNTALKSVLLNGCPITFSSSYSVGNNSPFDKCSNLETVVIKNSTINGWSLFCELAHLKKAMLINCVFDGSQFYTFQKCNALEHITIIARGGLTQRSINNCVGLKTCILEGNGFNGVTLNYATPYSNPQAIILTQNSIFVLGNSSWALTGLTGTYYVPSALLADYQAATNWSAVNATRPILAIEPNINDLRELGADFSYTQYANKKWENNQLVTDSTIGEEVS